MELGIHQKIFYERDPMKRNVIILIQNH